jgi:hypothetical protein
MVRKRLLKPTGCLPGAEHIILKTIFENRATPSGRIALLKN